MTDQGMLSLFGEEGPLFSEGLGDLGECSYPDGQQMVMEQGYGSLQQNLRELGQFHHYGQYEQPGGATLGSQQYHPSGPPQAPPSGPPMSQQHAGYQNMQAERQGQSFMGGSNMWGPGATPSPAPRPHAPLQPMGVYSAGVRGEYSQQNLPRGGPPPPSRFAGHVGPQQGSRMAGPPMHHPVQQQQQQRPRHHPAPGQFHPETVPHGRCFSPNTQPHPLHQPNMGFSPHGQPVPLSVPNGSARFPSYPSPNQGSAAAVGAGPNAMQAQGYAGASDFLPLGGPQGPVPHQQPLHGPQMGPAHSHQQQLQAPPPQMSYRSGSPMSPMKAVTNPTGPPAAPPQQGVAMGTGMEVGGYPGVPVQPPGAAGVSQTQQPLPPQPYRGMPQCQSSHNPLQQGQGMPFHQLPPTPLSQPHMTPPSHQQPWTQPHPLLPVTHKVPVSQPSPLDPSPETYPKLRPAANSGTQPLTSDPGDAHQKPKKKKQKKKKEKEKSEEEAEEKGEPATVNGPEQEVSSGAKKKKTKAKDPGTPKSPKTHKSPKTPKTPKSPKTPKTPKSPKTPKTPKEPKEKKVKTPKNGSATKPSIKKTSPETDTVAKKEVKRKRESSDHSDEEERIPPASPEEEEEDGGTQKRRSSRQVKRKRYTEELDFRISDDEGERREGGKRAAQSDQAAGADGPIVEKIMAVRQVKKENAGGEEVEVEEFYVKFKALSYLHCRWADMEELEKDKRIQQKVKRFKAKQSLNSFLSEMDEEPFNPDYVEVDRILDVSEGTDENGEPLTHYLVKWCSLPYEDSTWELQADVDPGKIQEFQRLMEREPELERVERPPADEWQELKTSREYQNSNGLREYQLEGVNWLLFNWYNTRNCILADEMGLGKTIQSITFLYEMFLKGVHGPFLVIAPLSTIPNWDREFRTWTNLNVVVYHGSQASRKTIQAYEMNFRDEQGAVIKGAYKFHALITTFEMILTDCPELRSVGWRCVVIDEAHRLKNRNCKLLEGLKMMDMEHKVLLTGTPLQNTVEELFSLLNFLEPLRFPSEATFMQEFGDLKTEEQVQQLQAILKPMMLRRLKEDVEKNLAPKEETIIEVELTNVQKKYYRAILEKNFAFLSKGGPGAGGGGNGNVPNLLNTMMELRKCCNHPYLITGAEEKIVEEFRETHPCEGPELALQAMVQAAGKLVLIDKLLPKLKAGGHRVLIFSQMVRCLDILEDYLIQKRYSYERIDGRVRGNLRQAAIDRFSRPDSDRFVFLLCTRAGGLGINLTAADTCVIFDSDWNPQNDLQAQARCHRIGQSKAVKIYRLITRNSYEREMFDKASLKLGLDKAVLQSMSGRENVANGVQQLSKKEIEDLLRKGAYGALMETEDEGSKFCEEDIDQILQRRTQTITIECDGKGSTFAKASFVSSGNRTDISLEDPDFWQKWAKKAELDMSVINRRNTLVIDTPRVRKQTRHFSAAKEDELLEFSELESDSEDPPTPRTRRPQDRAHGYPRSACFRVEKNLLVFGLGRWGDILSRGRFKRPLTLRDVETICRALLVYCVQHYRGDENIKSFIWDLITPTEDGRTRDLLNHSGLSAPVPRGRKGKKGKAQGVQPFLHQADWLASCNPNTLLQEDSYKKHLKHHCNKVLLRVRMLYYLKQEVIGSQADKILEGADSSEIDIWIPQPFLAEMPCDWWDREADKSLLIGVFKHGYEKYNSMRADPALHFLEKVGLPDPKAIAAEQGGADLATDGTEGGDLDREDEDPEYRPARMAFKEEMEECTNSSMGEEEALGAESLGPRPSDGGSQGKLRWPSTSALTGRLRRLIAAYQRSHKREQQRQEALLMIQAHRHHPQGTAWPMAPQREAPVPDRRQRWTRREEADFYRVVSTFGVLRDGQRFDWRHFRTFARLDRRTDHHLEGYFLSFVAMCRRVCHLPLRPEDETLDPTVWVEPITAERASRTMYRIELLRRIREQVLPHPGLAEGLRLCQPSPDLPEWWECGRHDRDLLLGASKHGLSRTDYHIFNDPELGFLEAHRKFSHPPAPAPKDQQTAPKPLPQKTEDGCDRVEGKAEAGSPKEEEHREEGATSLRGEPGSEGEEAQLKAEEEEKQQAGLKAEAEQMDPSPEGKEAELKSEGEKTEPKAEGQEAEPKAESKPLSEKGSEEDDEDKMEEDYKSESSQAEASAASKAFDEESNASLSTALDETRDGFPAEDAPVVCDRSFSFFHWPKDRVVIDRLDVICETVLKGKWPANRRQLFEFPAPQLPGYGPAAATGSPATRGFGELAAAGQASGSEETTLAPQDESESVSAPFLPSQRRGWRRAEAEAERVAKRRHLMDMVAQLRESHGHAHAGGQSTSHASPAFSLPASSAPCDARSSRAESPSGTPPNGAFTEDELPMKRRRGRRRNVEGLDLLFARHRKEARNPEDSEMTKAFLDGVQMPAQAQRNIASLAGQDPKNRGALDNLVDRNGILAGGALGNKNLAEWLGRHPSYASDTPSYSPKREELPLSPFPTPKQKRHRCRNPSKIDVNTLTGDERVPVVNRRSGRKLGGSFAPPMRDLPRWLKENPEFAVSPDWTDIVKQSGFLPESMFGGLLTGPVVREEGVCRRGRRPKSEGVRGPAPVAATPPAGLNPLLMGGLMGGLQSLQLAGLMGFPSGDPKQAAALLPLMLPNMLSLGGLFGNLATTAGSAPAGQGEPDAPATPKKEKEEEEEEDEEGEGEREVEEEKPEAEGGAAASASAISAAMASMSTNALAFNPFLLSAMAPGLFYPSMFLPPGLSNLGNLGNLPGNLSNLGNLPGNLSNLGNLGNLANLGNLGYLSNLGNLGNLGLSGLPQALAGLQSAMAGASVESAVENGTDECSGSGAENDTGSSTENSPGAGTGDPAGSSTGNVADSSTGDDCVNDAGVGAGDEEEVPPQPEPDSTAEASGDHSAD